jgi:hypothetical protein
VYTLQALQQQLGATTLTRGRGWHLLAETKWLQNDLSHEGCTADAPQQCSLRASTPKIEPVWLGKIICHAQQVSAAHGVQVHRLYVLGLRKHPRRITTDHRTTRAQHSTQGRMRRTGCACREEGVPGVAPCRNFKHLAIFYFLFKRTGTKFGIHLRNLITYL